MMNMLRPLLVIFGLLVLITGVLYPLAVTGLAQAVFPTQANGSLVERDGRLVGSSLIGQDFQALGYFWGRPSATMPRPNTAFDAGTLTGSAGSNLGPLSKTLAQSVQERVARLRAADPGNPLPIPVDMVAASASGLDPHISLAAAYYQVGRVARARGLSEAEVRALVDRQAEGRQWALLGEPHVNVLLLNLALDALQPGGVALSRQ